jgi:hypothetical protein
MIEVCYEETILYIKVLGTIEKEDFETKAKEAADHIISEYGKIRGILIDAGEFEGWKDFPALLEYIGFVKEMNHKVYRVAIIGDATWQKLIPAIANLFLDPVVKRFDTHHGQEAEDWIKHW